MVHAAPFGIASLPAIGRGRFFNNLGRTGDTMTSLRSSADPCPNRSMTMKMPKCVFMMGVAMVKGMDQVAVTVTVSEGEVTPEQLVATLTGGSSPRVNLQGYLRKHGIPKNGQVTRTWEEFVGVAKASRTIATRPMTKDEILNEARGFSVAELQALIVQSQAREAEDEAEKLDEDEDEDDK